MYLDTTPQGQSSHEEQPQDLSGKDNLWHQPEGTRFPPNLPTMPPPQAGISRKLSNSSVGG